MNTYLRIHTVKFLLLKLLSTPFGKKQPMKFRRLTNDELQELEKEFVQFLVSNTITAEDWEKIKKENPERAEGLIGIFSDIVFEKVIGNIQYLEHRTPKNLRAYYCVSDRIYMLGILVEGKSDLDLSKDDSPADMMQKLQTSEAALKVFSGEKKYKKEKALEIFELMQEGALISHDGNMFKLLSQLVQQK